MATKNRNIRRRGFKRQAQQEHIHPAHWGQTNWMVPFEAGNAVTHHNHEHGEDHGLCGPLVFCCSRAVEAYRGLVPQVTSGQITWEKTPAEQVITWLDAGVQMVYFIFIHPGAAKGVSAVGLSGDDARKALLKELALDAYVGGGEEVMEELLAGKSMDKG